MYHEYRSFLFDEFPFISQDSLEKIPPPKKYYCYCLLQLLKCDNLHKLCAVLVPVPGSGSCIAVSLYRFLVLAEKNRKLIPFCQRHWHVNNIF